jgi:hypothetical protein
MEPPIFVQIDENPNCAAMDGLVFQPKAPPREVRRVRISRDGAVEWREIEGVDEGGAECRAQASLIDDSGDGCCYLITGGAWGLKLSSGGDVYGEPYLVLGADGADVEFA